MSCRDTVSGSRLLNLPIEIQCSIFYYAVGNNNIHLERRPRNFLDQYNSVMERKPKAPFLRALCRRITPNPFSTMYPCSDPTEAMVSRDNPLLSCPSATALCSKTCVTESPFAIHRRARNNRAEVRAHPFLPLLLTCKHIYGAASRMVFTENTLMFQVLCPQDWQKEEFSLLHDSLSTC